MSETKRTDHLRYRNATIPPMKERSSGSTQLSWTARSTYRRFVGRQLTLAPNKAPYPKTYAPLSVLGVCAQALRLEIADPIILLEGFSAIAVIKRTVIRRTQQDERLVFCSSR
jgi:hypothetical protein